MTRERTRFRVLLTTKRPPERTEGNVLCLTERMAERREPPADRTGLEGFLAALPRVLAVSARAIANDRGRSTCGDDAA